MTFPGDGPSPHSIISSARTCGGRTTMAFPIRTPAFSIMSSTKKPPCHGERPAQLMWNGSAFPRAFLANAMLPDRGRFVHPKSFNFLDVRVIDRRASGLVFTQHAFNPRLTTDARHGTSPANECDEMSVTRQEQCGADDWRLILDTAAHWSTEEATQRNGLAI